MDDDQKQTVLFDGSNDRLRLHSAVDLLRIKNEEKRLGKDGHSLAIQSSLCRLQFLAVTLTATAIFAKIQCQDCRHKMLLRIKLPLFGNSWLARGARLRTWICSVCGIIKYPSSTLQWQRRGDGRSGADEEVNGLVNNIGRTDGRRPRLLQRTQMADCPDPDRV